MEIHSSATYEYDSLILDQKFGNVRASNASRAVESFTNFNPSSCTLANRGRTLSGRGRTPSGRGRTLSGRGRTLSGRGRTLSGRGRTLSGRGRTPSGRGRTLSGRGRTLSGRGRTLSGRGRTPSGRGRTLSGRGRTLSGRGRTLCGRGRTLSGRGRTLSGRGRTLSGRGRTPSGRDRAFTLNENSAWNALRCLNMLMPFFDFVTCTLSTKSITVVNRLRLVKRVQVECCLIMPASRATFVREFFNEFFLDCFMPTRSKNLVI